MPEQMQKNFAILIYLWAVLFCLCVQTAGRAAAIVDLQPESLVSGEEVRLEEVAKIVGANAAQKRVLGDIVLAHAPAPARSQDLRRSYIVAKMKQHFIDMDSVVIRGPEKIRVSKSGNLLRGKTLVEKAKQYVLKHTGWSEKEVRFDVPRLPQDRHLPEGQLEIEVWKVSGDFYGMTHFRTDIRIDGQSTISVPLVMTIHPYKDVVVAARPLQKGEVLTADALVVRQKDLSREMQRVRRSNCGTEIEPLLGKTVQRYVDVGSVLTWSMLEDPPIVERGDKVAILVNRGGISITTSGEARLDGTVGQTIPVRNLSSSKVVMAKVVRPGVVTIE
jgi:flagellar basal body P-ring formation protein FlgA